MDELELAQVKDRILRYLLDNDNSKAEDVFKALDKPTNHIDQFREVALDMFRHDHKYFKIRQGLQYDENDSGTIYYKTDLTKPFLEIGGFTSIYEQREKDLLMERKVKKASDKKTLYWWVPIAVSFLSLCFAVYPLTRKHTEVTKDEIKTIHNKIDSLRSDFKKENTELKEKLYKAELMISVYEDSKP
ncbi:hypothetical protein [Maribacter stanieri]|uniref:Uncharacterized protein n=1 Tax=Maribacter stanieri TaxID=440514 RepID=A0A1I6IEJ7_9FLAO|nr:hypothetical protein [Maribacter stanieri]SFR65207.1 hypothetical protein SAMN04488010_1584 [Maribacter stanieri]